MCSRLELLHTELVLACTGISFYLHAQNMLLNLVQLGFSAPQQPGPMLLKHRLQQQSGKGSGRQHVAAWVAQITCHNCTRLRVSLQKRRMGLEASQHLSRASVFCHDLDRTGDV